MSRTREAESATGYDTFRELAEVYNHLTSLALQGADVAAVTKVLAERLGHSVALLQPSLEPLAVSTPAGGIGMPDGWPTHDPRLANTLAVLGDARRAARLPASGPKLPALVVGPIMVAGETAAYVVTLQSSKSTRNPDFDLLVTEHAATVCAAIMSRNQALADVAGQVREELIDALLIGRVRTPEDRQKWARHVGYRPDRSYRCLVIGREGPEFAVDGSGSDEQSASTVKRSILHAVTRLALTRAPSAIVAARRQEIIVLAQEDAQGPALVGARRLADLLAENLAERFRVLEITIGIGGVCTGVDEVSESYEQACRAILAATSLGQSGRAVAFEDLGLFQLLLQVPQLGGLSTFARGVFGDLIKCEEQSRIGLLKTLSAYFRHNGSCQLAGDELHMHRNTVRYRLSRIEDLSGLHLDLYRDRLLAEVALTIIEGLEPSLVSGKV